MSMCVKYLAHPLQLNSQNGIAPEDPKLPFKAKMVSTKLDGAGYPRLATGQDRHPGQMGQHSTKRPIFPPFMLLTSLYTKMKVIVELSVPKNHSINHFEKIKVLIEAQNYENIHI